MGDISTDVTNPGPVCKAEPYQPNPASKSLAPVDTPHGLAGAMNALKDYFLGTPNFNILPQLLDRPGSRAEIAFSVPLREKGNGEYLSEVKVPGRDQRLYAGITLKDGYPDGTIDFFRPVIQGNFKGTVDLPSNPLLGNSPLSLDVDVHRMEITTRPNPKDPAKRSIHFSSLNTHPLLFLIGTYLKVDVTELVTRRYLGRQMPAIDFALSQFVEMAITYAHTHPFADPNMADITGVSFNAKVTSNGELPSYEGPYKFCTERRNEACSSLLLHWDNLAIGKGVTLHDIDLELFLFPNPATGGFVVEIPSLKIGKIVTGLVTEAAMTLANLRVKDVILEVDPKDPKNSSAGFFIRKGKGTLLASGFNAMDDIQIGPLGSGIEFEIDGDRDNNLSSHLSVPGLLLDKADLLVRGGAAVHVQDAALLNADLSVDYRNGVLSYQASLEPHLRCAAFSGVLEQLGVKTSGGATGLSCETVSLSSGNVLESHRAQLDGCGGSMTGEAGPLEKSPWRIDSLTARFNDFNAGLAIFPDAFALDYLSLSDFNLLVKGAFEGYGGTFRLEDGPRRRFKGVDLPPGLDIRKRSDGLLAVTTNVKDEVAVKNPDVAINTKGSFLGRLNLASVSKNPADLRPVAGSLDFDGNALTSVRWAWVDADVASQIAISDDPSGMITVSAPSSVTRPFPGKFGPYATVDLQPSVKKTPAGVSYYDKPHQVGVEARLPFGTQEIGLNETTTITLKGGGVWAKKLKTEEKIGIDLRPPDTLEVKSSFVLGGMTWELSGDLKNNASFKASLDPKQKKITFDQSSKPDEPTLSGLLALKAQDGKGKILGEGTIDVTTSYQVSGSADFKQAKLKIRIPETGITGVVKKDIVLPGLPILAGSRFRLPIKGLEGDVVLNPKTLEMKSTWTAGDISSAQFTLLGDKTKKVVVDLTTLAGGRRWSVTANPISKKFGLQTLPGPDGSSPPPLHFDLSARGEGKEGFSFSVDGDSAFDLTTTMSDGLLAFVYGTSGTSFRMKPGAQFGDLPALPAASLSDLAAQVWGSVDLDHSKVDTTFNLVSGGPLTLTLPAAFVEKVTDKKLKEQIMIRMAVQSDQPVRVLADLAKGGASASVVKDANGSLKPLKLELDVAYGKSWLTSNLETSTKGMEGSFDPATGIARLTIQTFSLEALVEEAKIAKGDHSQETAKLTEERVSSDLDRLEIAWDIKTGLVQVDSRPPQKGRTAEPPKTYDKFQAWEGNGGLKTYQLQLKGNPHLASLSPGIATFLAANGIAPEKGGPLYIDQPPFRIKIDPRDPDAFKKIPPFDMRRYDPLRPPPPTGDEMFAEGEWLAHIKKGGAIIKDETGTSSRVSVFLYKDPKQFSWEQFRANVIPYEIWKSLPQAQLSYHIPVPDKTDEFYLITAIKAFGSWPGFTHAKFSRRDGRFYCQWSKTSSPEAINELSKRRDLLEKAMKAAGLDITGSKVDDYLRGLLSNLSSVKKVEGYHTYDTENGLYAYSQEVETTAIAKPPDTKGILSLGEFGAFENALTTALVTIGDARASGTNISVRILEEDGISISLKELEPAHR